MQPGGTASFRSAYGIDFAAGKAIPVRAARKGVQILDETPARPRALSGLAGLAASERSVIACAMPARSSFTQWIKAPFASLPKARRVFDSLLDLQMPFPVDQCPHEFICVGHGEDGNVEALAVGARREHVERQLEDLRELGLDPELLDHEGVALWDQARRELPCQPGQRRAVVYLGEERIVVSSGCGERFEFSRHSELRPDADSGGAQRILRPSPQGGESELEIIWVGPRAEDGGLRDAVAAAARASGSPRESTADQPRSFLARALAERALGRDTAINLRRAELLHPRLIKARQGAEKRLALAALLAGLLLCAGNALWVGLLEQRHSAIQDELRATAVAMTGNPNIQKGLELDMVRAESERLQALRALFAQIFDRSTTVELAEIARFASSQGIVIDRLELSSSGLSISGAARDWNICRGLADFIMSMGFDAELERSAAGADELVHFRIEGGREDV